MAVSSLVLGIVALALPVIYWLSQIGKRPSNYPPGPPTIPILGMSGLLQGALRHC